MQNLGRPLRILKAALNPCGGFVGVLCKCSKFGIPIKKYFTLAAVQSVIQMVLAALGCTQI